MSPSAVVMDNRCVATVAAPYDYATRIAFEKADTTLLVSPCCVPHDGGAVCSGTSIQVSRG